MGGPPRGDGCGSALSRAGPTCLLTERSVTNAFIQSPTCRVKEMCR
ncbi:hypothetical protein BQ8420_25565 [Nocardiopsis sp. JB363]|nr:hypothetical protein BQ8420_25565 [Nocardiopsis sp. JB363]